MKATEEFKKTIIAKLDEIASNDPLFAISYKKENKNIDDCITYILNFVKNSGCTGFLDEEIYGKAMHYYDEDDIDIGAKIECKVVVNHQVQLTEEEIQEAKQKAIDNIILEERLRLKQKNTPKKVESKPTEQQASLF